MTRYQWRDLNAELDRIRRSCFRGIGSKICIEGVFFTHPRGKHYWFDDYPIEFFKPWLRNSAPELPKFTESRLEQDNAADLRGAVITEEMFDKAEARFLNYGMENK